MHPAMTDINLHIRAVFAGRSIGIARDQKFLEADGTCHLRRTCHIIGIVVFHLISLV